MQTGVETTASEKQLLDLVRQDDKKAFDRI